MITSTVAVRAGAKLLLLAAISLALCPLARAQQALGPWAPLFKGIDQTQGTNTPTVALPNQHVVYLLRVDLHDPDIRLFSSPRLENFTLGAQETAGYTVTDFLKKHHLQVAINAGLFDPQEYYLPAGTPMDIAGMSVSEGRVVSESTGPDNAATVAFTAANVPTVIHTNWPSVTTAGIETAVSGSYPILYHGVNLGFAARQDSGFIHRTNPRTAFGVSQDQRYLYLMVIDGRQPGYSVGAYDYETAAWLLLAGAYDGVNMDGGGSSTLVVEGSTGDPLRLNRPSAVADSGRERTVGSHFGIYASPATGFINDLAVKPSDTSALVTWTTTAAASSQVHYGLTADVTQSTELLSAPTTTHSLTLSGLIPGSRYYFLAQSSEGTTDHVSPVRSFVTSNFVNQVAVFGFTQPWKYSVANLDGQIWTTPGYDDSAWAGPEPGILWADSRGSPRADFTPASTQMPVNSKNSGYPYPTYYFRTRFTFAQAMAGTSLTFTNYLDDGAVFYLNGVEIQRLRMDDAPAIIANDTLATGFGCSGDATCTDVFTIRGDLVGNLQNGENVLAVEVHNYNARSADITFGLALTADVPLAVESPTLTLRSSPPGSLTLQWSGTGFSLQEAEAITGPWRDTIGPVTSSPFTTSASGESRYYRLRRP